ncbi:MAG: transposase [Selenomonadaceae bacterium]|nr:transposase [Selenomonadaceae bacterium]
MRCLFRQFLSKQTDASLNSYYRALGNELVTDASIRQALALRALSIVPEALRQEPILLSVDDTTIAKWGKHFDGVGILYDHAKRGLLAHALSYPNLNVICNARRDTAMFELPDSAAGHRGRPPKYGRRLKLDEIPVVPESSSYKMDGYLVSHRLVKTRIFGDRAVHAYVTLSKNGSRRLFFSTVNPMALHMSITWQESKTLRDTSSKLMTFYPIKLYKLRWGIETNYYEQKMFWELGSYKVRTKTAIEHLLNLTNAGHALMKILPYEDKHLRAYQDKSPQELRHALSQQIHKEVFFATLVSKAQSSINSSTLLKALQALAWGDEQAA